MEFEIFEIGILYIGLLFGVGTFAGFLNTVAFGGSLITLPSLIFLLNLPGLATITQGVTNVTAVANGSNRIAIL